MDLKEQEKIERLERQAKSNPLAYKFQLLCLALLGYFYFLIVIVGLLLLTMLVCAIMFALHLLVLIKLAFLTLIPIWVIAKSMWIKYTRPQGITLRAQDAPKLFDFVHKIRLQAGGPRIDQIMLLDEFNCAIAQFPRLGLLGFHENYLLLGLPLLDSLTLDELKAVIAHEMGHLSSQHGKFSSWVYSVRQAWIQTYVNLNAKSSTGNTIIRHFAEWFVPEFSVHTMALMRQHEYAADEISAKLCGAKVTTRALIKSDIKGWQLSSELWPSISKQYKVLADPPADVFEQLRDGLKMPIDEITMRKVLQNSSEKHDRYDSHPTLIERVHALQPDVDWSDPNCMLASLSESAIDESTSSSLMDKALPSLTAELARRWRTEAEEAWRSRHAFYIETKTEFDRLQEIWRGNSLLTDEQIEELGSAAFFVLDEESVELIGQLCKTHPHLESLHFLLGVAHLQAKMDEGRDILEALIEREPQYGCDSCQELANYAAQSGDMESAENYMNRAIKYKEQFNQSLHQLSHFTKEDQFVDHTLSAETVLGIKEVLAADRRIKKAYLVAKKLPAIIGSDLDVLVLELNKQSWLGYDDNYQNTVISELLSFPEMKNLVIVQFKAVLPNLKTACQTSSKAILYSEDRRDDYTNSPRTTEAINRLKEFARSRPTFFKKYAWIPVIFALCFVTILGLLFAIHQEALKPRTTLLPRYGENRLALNGRPRYTDFQSYLQAFQQAVKRNWFPPSQGPTRSAIVRFKIWKNGSVTDAHIIKTSGLDKYDQASLDAVMRSSYFAVLPDTDRKYVDVQFTFDYNVHKNIGVQKREQTE